MDRASVTCALVCVVRSTYVLKDACSVAEQVAVSFILREFVLATAGYSFVVRLKSPCM